MPAPVKITLSGYGPPHTSFSVALKMIGERLEAKFPGQLDLKYVFNIMDVAYKAEDNLWLVDRGILSLAYQSSSYLTDDVPELGFLDLPFLFPDNMVARRAMDGEIGRRMVAAIEARKNYRILGWFENGMRHLSNRLRPVRTPADLAGMSIRILQSDVHKRTFELLGARPMRMDLSEARKMITEGTIDAQENPLANTVTYGVHNFHKYHTLTSHFYLSRPIFVHRDAFESWPKPVQEEMRAAVADAVTWQRQDALREHEESRKAIEAAGGEIVELTDAERALFRAAVKPQLDEARSTYDAELFSLLARL